MSVLCQSKWGETAVTLPQVFDANVIPKNMRPSLRFSPRFVCITGDSPRLSNGTQRTDHQLKTCLKNNSSEYCSCAQSAALKSREIQSIYQSLQDESF